MSEVKKVNLQYLLDNDKWQLKVTPEQSELVQLALFDVGFGWIFSKNNIRHTNTKYLSLHDGNIHRSDDKIDGKHQVELEEQKPQNDFETQQQIWEWLIGGGKVKDTKDGKEIISLKNGFVGNEYDIRSYNFLHPSDWKKVINWYDKLDGTVENGSLCWVGGNEDNLKLRLKIELIKEYRKIHHQHDGRKYKGSLTWWELVIPLTDDEIKAFMVGE